MDIKKPTIIYRTEKSEVVLYAKIANNISRSDANSIKLLKYAAFWLECMNSGHILDSATSIIDRFMNHIEVTKSFRVSKEHFEEFKAKFAFHLAIDGIALEEEPDIPF